MRLCYRFSGLNFDQLYSLDVYSYRVILINAIAYEANKTEEGKEMLEKFRRINEHNTEADIESLRELFS